LTAGTRRTSHSPEGELSEQASVSRLTVCDTIMGVMGVMGFGLTSAL
jgi:hypothetical protein